MEKVILSKYVVYWRSVPWQIESIWLCHSNKAEKDQHLAHVWVSFPKQFRPVPVSLSHFLFRQIVFIFSELLVRFYIITSYTTYIFRFLKFFNSSCEIRRNDNITNAFIIIFLFYLSNLAH